MKILDDLGKKGISAGLLPSLLERLGENVSQYESQIDIDEAYHILTLEGDGMNNTLFEGDLLIIKALKENKVKHGGVHIVLVNGELFCYRVYIQSNCTMFTVDNPKYSPFAVGDWIDDNKEIQILGEVIGVQRPKKNLKKR